MKGKDARKQIANEFRLGEKTVEYIIYIQKRDQIRLTVICNRIPAH